MTEAPDIKTLLAEMEARLSATRSVNTDTWPGPWRRTDEYAFAPTRRDEDGSRAGAIIQVKGGGAVFSAIADHIERTQPANMRAIIDSYRALEAERDRYRNALKPFVECERIKGVGKPFKRLLEPETMIVVRTRSMEIARAALNQGGQSDG